MKSAAAAADDEVVPPISVCVSCGLSLCAGCAPAPRQLQLPSRLPWEDPRQRWAARLWSTALASSLEPARFFGELPQGGVASALAFAFWAEALALGSIGLLAVAGLRWVAPELTLELLASPTALWALAGVCCAAMLSMLGLHALWGACLDLGARGSRPRASFSQGVRFGLYACGWDLLTSPIGILGTLLTRGPRRGWSPILAAVRAPLLAQRAFLCQALAADAAGQRRARKLAVLSIGAALSALLLLSALAVVYAALRFGY